MRKATKATDISQAVKKAVWDRDGGRCILCLSPSASPNAHFIGRAQMGLGVEQNVVTLCSECHRRYDQTIERHLLRDEIRAYLKSRYEDWDETKLVYRKYGG